MEKHPLDERALAEETVEQTQSELRKELGYDTEGIEANDRFHHNFLRRQKLINLLGKESLPAAYLN